jgi:hypothetical protein
MADACARCGSAKVIPDVPLRDHYGDAGWRSDDAKVEVGVRPWWIFQLPVSGKLSARICRECGYAELRVSNPQELYEAYQRSLAGPAAPTARGVVP